MSNASETPWSNNPNIPHISHTLYVAERGKFIGDSIAAILYGVVIALFFQCMRGLFDRARDTRGGIKWALVAHTVAMFLFVTISIAMGLNLQAIAYVNNRDFPGAQTVQYTGPVGYKELIYPTALSIVPNATFQLNQWLADGLLLYRCCVIYAMKYWVTAVLCPIYLASVVLGLLDLIWSFEPSGGPINFNIDTPYYLISFSLNVILTLMIIIRLVLHSREIQQAMGGAPKVGRIYKAIVLLLVESCALYVISLLPFIILSFCPNPVYEGIFWPILNETQVMGPFLIVRQVGNRSSVTSNSTSWNVPSIRFGGQGESTGDSWVTSGSDAASPMDPGVLENESVTQRSHGSPL